MDSPPQVIPLKARDLGGILEDIRTVGHAVRREAVAGDLVRHLERRLRQLSDDGADESPRPRPARRVLCVEGLDPLYLAGHWVPELVRAAGGEDVGAESGGHSTRRSWGEAVGLYPDIVLVMLCGFGVDRSEEELAALRHPIARQLLGETETWVLDGNSYTSRPGPRVVDGAVRIRAALQGQEMDGLRRHAATGVQSG